MRCDEYVKPIYPKTEEEMLKVRESILKNDKASVLFSHLTNDTIQNLVNAFYSMEVERGHSLIEQGDHGDRFYIVEHGSFDIFVARIDSATKKLGEPSKVGTVGPLGSFGELALLYNSPRAASVICGSESSKVWVLDGESFQMLVMSFNNEKFTMYDGWLQSVPLLQALNHFELTKLADLLQRHVLNAGDTLIHE